ncbi:M48 family metalloprotease [Candidatus Dactylopiibacterium carminicum]|nr:M48 family metalloprotease [Candidatus Dactylopiibacterium carminicum]
MIRPSFLRRLLALILIGVLTLQGAAAQLPDLGHTAQSSLSPAEEERIAEEILRQVRFQEPSYVNDPEAEEYLADIGQRLARAGSLDGRFRFFVLRDPTVNAFAMPGGVIGFHTGLIITSRTESELASVMAHEMTHVSQHHLARMLSSQGTNTALALASILAAVLIGRNSANVGSAVLAGGQAALIQNQLSYSRDYEREADRLGLQMLAGAGFDPQGMPDFFARMYAQTRSLENNASSYLSTHPLTQDRIADAGERVRQIGARPQASPIDYHLMRARIEVVQLGARTAIERYLAQQDKTPTARAATLYGLARAYLADHQPDKAAQQLPELQTLGFGSSFLVTLAADVAIAQGRYAEAARLCGEARARFPLRPSLQYCEAEAWLAGNDGEAALRVVDPSLRTLNQDYRLYALQARANTLLGRSTETHRAQAEVYALQGDYTGAIDQLELAQKAGGGDHIAQAAMDARLREMRRLNACKKTRKAIFREQNSGKPSRGTRCAWLEVPATHPAYQEGPCQHAEWRPTACVGR